ncbi:MAG: PepSY domain-containing protein [Pseudomonadota bacterium]
MRTIATAAVFALGLALPATAADVPEETVAAIMAKLGEMQCQMDEDDIEVEDDGFELDDVFCADGQYDIVMDADLNVVEQRKE